MAAEVVVLSGGDPVPPPLAAELPAGAFVIAADGGLHLAAPLGLHVDLVVGDFDSVDAAALAAAEAAGAQIETHPVDKDATDLALALDAATRRAPDRITIVGGTGGRADHEIARWLLMTSEAYAGCHVRAWSATSTADVVRAGVTAQLRGTPGELVSLLPVHGPAREVTTDGLRYPLAAEDLPPGSSRGVSNQFAGPHASVALTEGVLLVVRPGELGPPLPNAPDDPAHR